MSLTFDEYQERTGKTAIYPTADTVRENLLELGLEEWIKPIMKATYADCIGVSYTGLGLGEVGEVQGKIKKIIRDAGGVITEEVRLAIGKEIGDCLWYLAQLCSELDIHMGCAAEDNLEKLASRLERGVVGGSGDDR